MNLTQLIERAAQTYPDAVSTICGERQRSWSQSCDRVSRLGSALKNLGVEIGDRVSMLGMNSDRYFEAYFGVSWCGGVFVPMNIRWSVAENLYSIEDSTPRVLLVDDFFLAQAQQILAKTETIKTVIHMGDAETPEGMLNFEALLQETAPMLRVRRDSNDVAGIFYTGGTTGAPKGVMLSHSNLIHSAMYAAVHIPSDGDARCLHAAPMFHIADFSNTVSITMMGKSHVFIPYFDPELTLKAIDAHKVTYTMLVPIMIQMLMDHPDFEKTDLSSLDGLVYGASPMSKPLLKRLKARLPELQLLQGYGQTEMAPNMTLLWPDDHAVDGPNIHRLGSVGQPLVGVDMKIVDELMNEVAQGIVGQIAVKGQNVMLGYWNKPEETAAAKVDGWLLTGDAGYFDEDGYLYLVDRVKDMIVSGAENVFSGEVENAICDHPAVNSVAVIGIPNDKWGEVVHAIVQPREGATVTEAEIIAHCREKIGGYKCPKSVEIRTEPFPVSGVGKVLKTELRKPYWHGKEKAVN
jgi:acyl-CoA synthetase (AMP-forming)/AMP-acid ligase II